MKRVFFIVLCVFSLEVTSFARWVSCWQFADEFYFTHQVMTNKLLLLTNNESGIPLLFVRLLFNKVFFFPWGILQTLIQYWDIRFLETFLSLVGSIGVFLGVWYFFTRHRNNLFLWVLFALGVIFPVIEMVFTPHIAYFQRLLPMFTVFSALSLYGIWQFLSGKKSNNRYLIILFLILISMLYLLLFPLSFQEFCLKV